MSKQSFKNIFVLLTAAFLTVSGFFVSTGTAFAADAVIDIAAIPGVTAPAAGEAQATTTTETLQYTGLIVWAPDDDPFATSTAYTATISLTAKPGFTFTGVAANFFTVVNATTTNATSTGEVTAEFAATAATTVINIAAIPGVTAPAAGAVPVTTTTETAQYTGAIVWAPDDDPFATSTAYTATISLTAKPGFTFTGVAANFFTVANATTTNDINTGVVTAEFAATAATTVINIAAIPGVTAPAAGAVPVTTTTETAQYTGAIVWAPDDDPFATSTAYTASISLTAKPGFTFTGVAANFFTVANATTTNDINTGEVEAEFAATAATTVINIAAIPGVTAPAAGAVPVTTTTETAQYTGAIVWAPDNDPFATSTAYTASISLTAKPGFTFTGVAANFFTVANATTTNDINTGEVEAEFAATAAATVINIAAIPGVTAPAAGAVPVTTTTETAQYTGAIVWAPDNDPFATSTAYTASISLTAKPGFTFTGVAANFFTVANATTTNDINTGVVTAEFAATAATTVINIAAIPGVTAPAAGAVPVTTTTETAQYTGAIVWAPDNDPFATSTAYTATISLTAKPGFTFTGVAANFFTVANATTTNDINTGEVEAEFAATAATTVINIAAIPGVTAPAAGAVPVTTTTETAQYTGAIVWAPDNDPFATSTAYTATISLTAKPGFTFTGVAANFFTVANATTTNDINTGEVEAEFAATAATTVINIAAIPGVTAPAAGAVPVTTTTETAQYTGAIVWAPDDDPFATSTAYTASISLTAKPGFTFTGVAANFFTVANATTTNDINTGEVEAEFAATAASITITAITAITGTPQFGEVLTAGALTPAGATVTYQWQSAATSGGSYTAISGATSSTYTPVADDVAKYIKVAATGTGSYSGAVTSVATAVVAAKPITAITAITGTPQFGEVLTAGALTPAGATVTYQWQSAATSGGSYTAISGATSSTYTPVAGDVAKYIKVAATGTGSYSGAVTSVATAVVAAKPITAITAITGTPQFGEVLTAGALTPAGATVTYQWQSAATSGGSYTAISGATSSTYTPVAGDVAKFIKVAATGTGSYSGTVTSVATAVVAAAPTTPIANVAVAATAVYAGDTLADSTLSGTFKNALDEAVAGSLTWDASTTVVSATASFAWTFTPTDTVAYNAVTGTVSVTALTDTQTAPDASGFATVNNTTPQVVITNPTQAVTLTISSGTTDPTIDVSAFITNGTGVLPAITITSANANNVNVAIPASTTVTSADSTWNGIISAPTITTITLPTSTGKTRTLSTAIELGFADGKLSFDKGVRILLPDQAGKRVGYGRTGITFIEITDICAADDQATGNALAVDGDCKIDVGSDLVIWTKHFTKFASYTQSTQSSGGSGGGAGVSATSANDAETIARLQAQLNSLIDQIKVTVRALIAQGKSVPAALMIYAEDVPAVSQTAAARITKGWSFGQSGEEVKIIQTILAKDAAVYPEGKVTGYFGPLTLAAVQRFQVKYDIAKPGAAGYGLVGPLTRAKLNGM